MNLRLSVATMLFAGTMQAYSADHVMEVKANKPGAPVQSTMYGLFFEDINYAADGGLYAEKVKNRSFEFCDPLMGWQSFGCVEVKDDGPFKRCPHYVVLSKPQHHDTRTGLTNEGFFGIGVKKGETYRFSVWAKAPKGNSAIRVQLIDENTMEERQEFATAKIDVTSTEWKKYQVELRSTKTMNKAKLRIFLSSDNSVALEHISLFPKNTFRGHENGLRQDIAQALADIHPGVLRFPGGCIVESYNLETRYQWKNSVGPVENRPTNNNRWESTFEHRYYPDYYQSYGLGFFEFFQFAEEIGAEPLPVISCGLACQFQNPDPNKPGVHVPLDQLDPYIQDALDLVEFANGDVNTTWGKVRAEMGHPEPFNLKFLGVGNEQWDYDAKHSPTGKEDPVFTSRLKKFNDALRAKYPNLKLVGTTGPNSEGWDFDLLQPRMKELKVDLYDEHYYRDERWFLSHGLRYDSYDREGPRVFAGEYACHGKGKKWNHYETSLYEAAHMTGLERNADLVHMATYAPLLAHVEGWQWRPDMVWYDNTRMFKTVSYYVQQMYAQNKGTNTLSLTMGGKPVAGQDGQDGLFASAVWDKDASEVIVKVVNTSDKAQPVTLNLTGMKNAKQATTITLSCTDMNAENTLDAPALIAPMNGVATVKGDKKASQLTDEVPAKTFRLYRIK